MAKEITDIKQFLEICRRKDASSARIKKSTKNVSAKNQTTKFKVRCSRHLYTLKLKDADKADKLSQSMPPALSVREVPKKNKKGSSGGA